MMKNVKFEISYDGTKYFGWEHQPNIDMTIQGKMETVLSRMVGKEVELIGAGRTDAGVHALNMVCNALFDTDMTEKEIMNYFNQYLPTDIAVNKVSFAGPRFHSRYNAIGKTYRYTCYMGDSKPIFDRNYVYYLESMPDIERMRTGALILQGEHDFAAFCTNPGKKKSTVRTVDKINIEKKGDYLRLTYHGNGFLQHMVRILTGTLLEVGYGNISLEELVKILESKDRKLAGPTAPAKGLTLVKIDYM